MVPAAGSVQVPVLDADDAADACVQAIQRRAIGASNPVAYLAGSIADRRLMTHAATANRAGLGLTRSLRCRC
jgi:hypothetical protein